MEIYNLKNLNHKQRFPVAIAVAIGAAVALAFIYAVFKYSMGLHIPYLYIAFSYAIAYAIKTVGRGVQPKFSYLGAGASILCIILSFYFYCLLFIGLSDISFIFSYMFRSIFQLNITGLIEMACIAYSIYVGFYNSRII